MTNDVFTETFLQFYLRMVCISTRLSLCCCSVVVSIDVLVVVAVALAVIIVSAVLLLLLLLFYISHLSLIRFHRDCCLHLS